MARVRKRDKFTSNRRATEAILARNPNPSCSSDSPSTYLCKHNCTLWTRYNKINAILELLPNPWGSKPGKNLCGEPSGTPSVSQRPKKSRTRIVLLQPCRNGYFMPKHAWTWSHARLIYWCGLGRAKDHLTFIPSSHCMASWLFVHVIC